MSIELQNVSYRYGEGTPFAIDAISDLSLTVPEGRITGIIGHTGSGKSTLIQLFNGLLRPTKGRVLLDGQDIWEKPKQIRQVRFQVGLVFQYPEYQLFEETVEEDISFGPRNQGLTQEEIEKRVREGMAFVGLEEEMRKKSPFELSGGEKRRVAIAGVLAMRPRILVLDEPAAGLDPMGRAEILGRLYRYQRETGCSVVMVGHSMEDMASYCDELIVLKQGTLFRQGSCKEIFSDAKGLCEIGLDIPQITALVLRLREMGVELPPDLYTVDQAQEAILALYRRKTGVTSC